MEEEKIQRLHDSLSKLRKGKGLGTNSQFSWNVHESIPLKKDKDGNMYREDGLPVNGLYSNFLKQGSYDPKKAKENSALKYGDGRAIKRNFDDIKSVDEEEALVKKSKEERKAEKKAAKLEAKKQAKIEEKKRLKLEAKKAAKKAAADNSNVDEPQEEKKKSKKEKKEKKSKKKSKTEKDVTDSANSSSDKKKRKSSEKEKKVKKKKKSKTS
ncbi:hypothetical protein CTEN210_16977 [Chaetoceros tenuissimus]|uniref:Uncharacterized protein n=1 Tax=Chaetoceros tenuissimus TaxID=426638 RepID=A0AAD3DC07_9STRA|nr:hypothetical protein CTEN210_16977 [Chaetoceros tenuissimus]